jgi:hypothetical protein
VSVVGARPNSSTYVYNEDGLRLRKTVNGTDTEYYYNGSVLMYMITGSGSTAVKQRFSYDKEPFLQKEGKAVC